MLVINRPSAKPKLPAEKRIEVVHVSLMQDKRFALFAGLFMVGKTSVDEITPTAKTNGRDATYGRVFVDSLTDKELAFLVMHENMHKCYRHLTTWRVLYDDNHELANRACDYVINLQLEAMDPNETMLVHPRDKVTGKRMGWHDPRFTGMDARQVYDILKEECKGGRKGKGPEGEGGQPSDEQGEPGDGNDRQGVDGSGLDEHDWEGAQDGLSENEKKQLERDIDQALRQGGIYAGKMGGQMSREIGELLTPKVDWREVVRVFVKTHLRDRQAPSWRKAHRNYLWQDIILPSVIGKRVKHLVLAMDTSGSVVGDLLTMFMSEFNKVVTDTNPERVDVLYWDTDVAGHETYKGADKKSIVHQTNPKGGGGTDPDCVPVFMQAHELTPDVLVILSDGYMSSNPAKWAGVTCPVLWCIIGSKSFTPPVGQLVNIKD